MKQSVTTEGKIIDAVLELFVRKGYHVTFIDQIMPKAGLAFKKLFES